MEVLKETKVRIGRVHTKQYEELNPTWGEADGIKRKQIFDEVGMEYKQLNILGAVVAEIIKANPTLLENPIIADGMAKFQRIEEIRNA